MSNDLMIEVIDTWAKQERLPIKRYVSETISGWVIWYLNFEPVLACDEDKLFVVSKDKGQWSDSLSQWGKVDLSDPNSLDDLKVKIKSFLKR